MFLSHINLSLPLPSCLCKISNILKMYKSVSLSTSSKMGIGLSLCGSIYFLLVASSYFFHRTKNKVLPGVLLLLVVILISSQNKVRP